MIDELANVSPNGNRICNWNLQLECNWKATAGNCTEEYVTGKTHAVVVLVKMVLSVPLQQNCALMRALRIQCYKSV